MCIEVAEACGRLPLALSLAAAQVRDGTSWESVLAALREGDLEYLDHPYGSIFKSMRLSVQALPEADAARYLELAVYPEDALIPEASVRTLWRHTGGLKDYQTDQLPSRLEGKALLYRDRDAEGAAIRFHDLQHDYLRLEADDLPTLHATLLDAYRTGLAAPDAWHTLPDGAAYPWTNLAYHLREAGQEEALESLLLSYDWIRAKLQKTDVFTLLEDYQALEGAEDVHTVEQALHLSAHALATDKAQLAGQLYGRLNWLDAPAMQALATEISEKQEPPWIRTCNPALTAPGGGEIQTLEGHQGPVLAVALSADGHTAVSASGDQTLKVWDLRSGALLRTLEGHQGSVWAVALSQDGHTAVSASKDRTLKVWDLGTGFVICTFRCEGPTYAVSVTAEGHTIVAGDGGGQVYFLRLERE